MNKRVPIIIILSVVLLFSHFGAWKLGSMYGSNPSIPGSENVSGITDDEITLNYAADFEHGKEAKCLELTFSTDEATLGCIKLPLTWDVYSSVGGGGGLDDGRVITEGQVRKYKGVPPQGDTPAQFVRMVAPPSYLYAYMENYYSSAPISVWQDNLSRDRYDSVSTNNMYGGTVVVAQSVCVKCEIIAKLYVFKRKLQYPDNNAATTEVISVTYELDNAKSEVIDKVAKLLIEAEIAKD